MEDDNSMDYVVPSDNLLQAREKYWLNLFQKYSGGDGNDDDFALSDLSQLCDSDDETPYDKEDECVQDDTELGSDDDDDDDDRDNRNNRDVEQTKQLVQVACQRRLDDWAASGQRMASPLRVPELGVHGARTQYIQSWLGQSLLPIPVGATSANVTHHHHSSTVMSSSSSSMVHNTARKVHHHETTTKTVTTIVKRVLVHSSTLGSGSDGAAAAVVHSAIESPLSDNVFAAAAPAPFKVTAESGFVDDDDDHNDDGDASSVQFRMPRTHRSRSPVVYRNTPHSKTARDRANNESHSAASAASHRVRNIQRVIEQLPIKSCLKDKQRPKPTAASASKSDKKANRKTCTSPQMTPVKEIRHKPPPPSRCRTPERLQSLYTSAAHHEHPTTNDATPSKLVKYRRKASERSNTDEQIANDMQHLEIDNQSGDKLSADQQQLDIVDSAMYAVQVRLPRVDLHRLAAKIERQSIRRKAASKYASTTSVVEPTTSHAAAASNRFKADRKGNRTPSTSFNTTADTAIDLTTSTSSTASASNRSKAYRKAHRRSPSSAAIDSNCARTKSVVHNQSSSSSAAAVDTLSRKPDKPTALAASESRHTSKTTHLSRSMSRSRHRARQQTPSRSKPLQGQSPTVRHSPHNKHCPIATSASVRPTSTNDDRPRPSRSAQNSRDNGDRTQTKPLKAKPPPPQNSAPKRVSPEPPPSVAVSQKRHARLQQDAGKRTGTTTLCSKRLSHICDSDSSSDDDDDFVKPPEPHKVIVPPLAETQRRASGLAMPPPLQIPSRRQPNQVARKPSQPVNDTSATRPALGVAGDNGCVDDFQLRLHSTANVNATQPDGLLLLGNLTAMSNVTQSSSAYNVSGSASASVSSLSAMVFEPTRNSTALSVGGGSGFNEKHTVTVVAAAAAKARADSSDSSDCEEDDILDKFRGPKWIGQLPIS